jgi:hypothetical protein
MGDLVNLRLVKKRRAKAGAEVEAAARRAQFGRTTAERQEAASTRDRADRILDQARLDPVRS